MHVFMSAGVCRLSMFTVLSHVCPLISVYAFVSKNMWLTMCVGYVLALCCIHECMCVHVY